MKKLMMFALAGVLFGTTIGMTTVSHADDDDGLAKKCPSICNATYPPGPDREECIKACTIQGISCKTASKPPHKLPCAACCPAACNPQPPAPANPYVGPCLTACYAMCPTPKPLPPTPPPP